MFPSRIFFARRQGECMKNADYTPEAIEEELFSRFGELNSCREDFAALYRACVCAYERGGKLLVAGNGGSASDSEHIVAELMKSFCVKRPPDARLASSLAEMFGERGAAIAGKLEGCLPVLPLTSMPAFTSAFSNDSDPSMAFAQLLSGYAREGDVFLAITTSGNSKNILNALAVARAMGISSAVLTGRSGGESAKLAQIAVRVPADDTGRIQEYHLPLYHALCAMLEAKFFGAAERR